MTDRDDLLRRVRRANPAPPDGALPAGVADSRPPFAWLIEGKHAMADTTPPAARHRWRGPAIAAAALSVTLGVALPLLLIGRAEEGGPAAMMPAIGGTRSECPAGSEPDAPGPTDQARPQLSGPYDPAVVMDTEAGVLVAVEMSDGAARTWTFDVCTNTWWAMGPPQEPELGEGARLVYDADARLTVAFPSAEGAAPWAYSSADNTWTERPATDSLPSPFWWWNGDVVFDPVSGLILLRDSTTADLWAYDVEANTWTAVDQGDTIPEENPNQQTSLGPHIPSLLTYDSAVDRLVLTLTDWPNSQTWTFDPRSGAWARQAGNPPLLNTGWFETGGETTFDAATGRTVIFSDGVLGVYDAAADSWETITDLPGWPTPGLNNLDALPSGPLARLGHTLVFDPLNQRVILVGGSARFEDRWWPADDVWAIDLRERKLVELLPGTQTTYTVVWVSPPPG